jgi:hypothetical protein
MLDFRDLTLLATPPDAIAQLTPAFASTLALIQTLVKDFENSFAYIKGFDSYTVQVREFARDHVQSLPRFADPRSSSVFGKASLTRLGYTPL